jgi:4'-phosphopantetheinyl transferase
LAIVKQESASVHPEKAAVVKCAPGEVHVWRITLDGTAGSVANLQSTLSPDERERAARFRTLELCDRWTAARGALRRILATYTGMEPASLVFETGPHGKPALASRSGSVSFNLSHTCGLALLGITASGQIGVDAESIRPGIEVEDLSRRFFAPAEADEILALATDAQLSAFFTCWTRKEAFVKALGIGLSAPLDQFRVTVLAGEPARLVSVAWDQTERWSLVDLSEPTVAAALAVEGPPPVVQRFNFAMPPT